MLLLTVISASDKILQCPPSEDRSQTDHGSAAAYTTGSAVLWVMHVSVILFQKTLRKLQNPLAEKIGKLINFFF